MRILHGLGSRVLGCGCLVGVYETYDKRVVAMIEVVGRQCRERDHTLHAALELNSRPAPDSDPSSS